MFSLRKTLYTTILLMAVILSMVFLVGARQYLLAGRYKAVIDQSEKLVFRFATVKEQITASLLENRYDQMGAITLEAEAMNGDIARVLESGLIPSEYKLTLLDQLDLPGVIILLRKMDAQPNKDIAGQINTKIRLIGDQLMRFDRIVASQAKAGLVEFQSVLIGGMAIVLCLCSFLMLLWYRQVIMPLLGLVTRCKSEPFGREILEHDPAACNELVELTQAMNGLIMAHNRQEKAATHQDHLLKAAAAVGEGIRQAKTHAELYQAMCRALMQDGDHALVWIGQAKADDDSLTPVAVDGSTTMDRHEYDACLDFLLSQVRAGGRENDPSVQALAQGSPIVARDILAGVPKGLLKNTPFAAGPVHCAALPLRWQDEVFGVVTIYALLDDSFQAADMEILRRLVDEAALACHALEVRTSAVAEEGAFNALTVRICGLAAMGELAAGVAHEVRNLVNGIINYSQVLFDEIGPTGGTQADLLKKVMDEGERIGDALRQLLFLSRGKRQTLSRLTMEHVVQGAYALVERQMKNDGISATIALPSSLPPVDVDLEYMQLVFLCLLNNARQALNGRFPGQDKQKRLAITGEVVFAEGRSWLRTSITDWGGGIDASVLPRIFDPLYSTKPAGEGTGLGLTLSKMLVEDHGGHIRIESVAGDHATVSIELPVTAAE
jgi:signal transduction histidine kinase